MQATPCSAPPIQSIDNTASGDETTRIGGFPAGLHDRTGIRLEDQVGVRQEGVRVIGLSVDPTSAHKDWIRDINETQNTTMNYPVIAPAIQDEKELKAKFPKAKFPKGYKVIKPYLRMTPQPNKKSSATPRSK